MATETPAPTEIVDKPTETVAPVVEQAPEEAFDKDRAMNTIHALREVEKKAKQDAKELAQLKAEKQQREDADLSAVDKLKKEAETAKAEAAQLKADILRRDVIAEVGLPAAFVDRLKGNTKDELLEDAKALKELLPTAKPTAPHLSASNPNGASATETDAQKRERLFGVQGNPFDLESIKKSGGGVIWNK